jgi:2-keto-4-pentenoate hydratase/2-oxohepta-3-ene-1,7-dioic acid hydratase in catechol pathway
MKLVTFDAGGKTSIGAWTDGGVIDLGDLAPTMVDFLAGGDSPMAKARERVRSGGRGALKVWRAAEVRLRAPILKPNKILCIGLNYADHAAEQGIAIPKNPVLFSKYWTSVIGPDEPIVLPRASTQVDYEAELAFVIGKRAKHVPESEAMSVIAGYTICHDVSARDFQFGDGQWVRGKTCDTFCPMGPWIVTADEIPDPHVLDIKLEIKGEVLQNSNTRNIIFKCAHLVHFFARTMTFEPGDVVSTGTPPGVGVFRKPPRFLQPGETVEITIQNVGTLRNPVVAET